MQSSSESNNTPSPLSRKPKRRSLSSKKLTNRHDDDDDDDEDPPSQLRQLFKGRGVRMVCSDHHLHEGPAARNCGVIADVEEAIPLSSHHAPVFHEGDVKEDMPSQSASAGLLAVAAVVLFIFVL